MSSLTTHRARLRIVPLALTPVFSGLQAAIGALLLAGLSGCGQASPDPIHREPLNTRSSTATTTHGNHQSRTDARPSSQQTIPPVVNHRTIDTRPQPQRSPDAARPAPNAGELVAEAARQQWFAEVRAHPDVTVRRQALELWAEQPSQGLDPLTYALVDADDSVRTRAQELYEQQLAREARETPGNAAGAPPTYHAE